MTRWASLYVFAVFYLVLLGHEWLEDVVPHAEEHRRVDHMERPGGKCTQEN